MNYIPGRGNKGAEEHSGLPRNLAPSFSKGENALGGDSWDPNKGSGGSGGGGKKGAAESKSNKPKLAEKVGGLAKSGGKDGGIPGVSGFASALNKGEGGGKGDGGKGIKDKIDSAKTIANEARAIAGDPKAIAETLKKALTDFKGFMKQNATGLKVAAGIGSVVFVGTVLMFSMIAIFTINQISAVAEAAGSFMSADGALRVGKSAAGKLWGLTPAGIVQKAVTSSEGQLSNPALAGTGTQPVDGVILAQDSVDGSAEVGTAVTKLMDQFDMSKSLEMLNQKNLVEYYNGRQKIKFEDLKNLASNDNFFIKIGGQKIDMSPSAEPAKVADQLTLAIRTTNLFAHDDRMTTTPGVKKIYADAGVNLERWAGDASEITDYGKNIKSAHTSVAAGTEKVTTKLSDIDATGDATTLTADEILDSNPSSGQKDYIKKVVDKSWEKTTGAAGKGSIENFTKEYQDSPALFTVASYCSALTYVEKYDVIAKQQFIGAQRNGIKILSAADQTQVGETGRQAVAGEAQRHENYEGSRSYMKAIGADVRAKDPDLNESQLAYQNPKIVRAAMQDVVEALDKTLTKGGILDTLVSIFSQAQQQSVIQTLTSLQNLFGKFGFASTDIDQQIHEIAKNILCVGISTEEGKATLLAGDALSRPIASTAAELHGYQAPTAGEQGAYLVVKTVEESLKRHGANQFAKTLVKDTSSYSKPSEEMIDFMMNSHKALDYAGLDDGINLLSKEFQGTGAFYNDVSRKNGGRPLTTSECAEKKASVNAQDVAIRNTKPLYARLFSPKQPFSPVSLALSHAPLSKQGAVDKTRYAVGQMMNPISGITNSTQKLAYSLNIADNPAFAVSDNVEDNELCYGYSLAEEMKLKSDPTYWQIPNSVIVEQNLAAYEAKYKDCIEKPMYELIVADPDDPQSLSAYGGKCNAENLSTPEALRYRTYIGDIEQLQSTVDMQEITEDAAITPIGASTSPEGEITEAQTVVIQACEGDARTFQGIAQQVEALCTAANSGGGINLAIGNSWRSTASQIEVRKSNCGTSQYAIYEAPASSCSPPTAKPGKSNHQRGVAIDFANCSSRSTACYQWLSQHAAEYGLQNLPSEPWHWSVDGK